MSTDLTPTPNVEAVLGDALFTTYGQQDTERTAALSAKVVGALRDAGLVVVPDAALTAARQEATRQRETYNHRFPSYASTSDEAWKRNPRCGCGSDDCDTLRLIDLLIGPTDPGTIPGACDTSA